MNTDLPKRIVVDIDGTLCEQVDDYSKYASAQPRRAVISYVNALYIAGTHVTIFTARGMDTHRGNIEEIEKNLRPLTTKWLSANGVLYDRLLFGKPPADLYVDDKAEYPTDTLTSKQHVYPLVFTNGCFDLLHRGHIETLRFAAMEAGKKGCVVVGLNSDASVTRLKGSSRPIQDQETRKSILESLRFVDRVIIFDEDTPEKLINSIHPDIIVKGSEYAGRQVVGSGQAKVKLSPWVSGVSTSETISAIKDRNENVFYTLPKINTKPVDDDVLRRVFGIGKKNE